MTARPLVKPAARMLNHVEFVYAPGDRALVRKLFEALGFRVLDPQIDPVPKELGPAAGPYLIVFLDPDDEDLFDNVLYASEASEAQWRFETAIRDQIASNQEIAERYAAYKAGFSVLPQAMTHVGVAYPNAGEVAAAMTRLSTMPGLATRLELSAVFEPGGPGSVDDRVVQAFVYTDLISVGLLCGGQQLELQVRLVGG